MEKALALTGKELAGLNGISPLDCVRFCLVNACGLALVLAGNSLPF
jgi:hypothetical protein